MDLARRLGLHYMTDIANLETILKHGILSRTTVLERGVQFSDISDGEVQIRREQTEPIFGRRIHDYVPLYLNPRNAMLYKRKELQDRIAILRIDPDAVLSHATLYTDGNAAASSTEFSLDPDIMLGSLQALEAEFWTNVPDGRRRRMAEVLIHESVPPDAIERVACNNHQLAHHIREEHGLYAAVEAEKFFRI